MSADVLLIFINNKEKMMKCEAFCNEFKKFNNTQAQMLDSIS